MLAVVLLVTGCAQQPPAEQRPDAEVVPAVDCTVLPRVTLPSGAPPREAPRAGSIPDGFAPVAAVLCSESWDAEPIEHEGGLYTALSRQTFTGDLDGLLLALSRPDDPVGLGPCTADMEIVPDLWLVDDQGAAMRAEWPRDRCGKTKQETHEALAALTLSDTASVPDQPIDREAYETGCAETAPLPTQPFEVGLATESIEAPGAFPGSVAPTAEPQQLDGSEPFVPAVPRPAELPRACLYAVVPPTPDEPITVPGLDEPLEAVRIALDGLFLLAVDLDRSQQDAVLAALDAPATGAECTETPTAFATFPPKRTQEGFAIDPALVAELDGCRRLFAAFQTVHDLPASVADALAVHATQETQAP